MIKSAEYAPLTNAADNNLQMPGKTVTPEPSVIENAELIECQRRLKLAVDFLRWLASAARADWDMRRRVIATLRAMGEWDE